MGQFAAGSSVSPAPSTQSAWDVSRALAVSFVYLEALDRATLASLTVPLTTPQYHALAALADAPHQSLGNLANRLLCDKANASGIVDRLEALRLVTRVRTPSDRRRVSLTPTSRGFDVLADATTRRAAGLHRALEPIRSELPALLEHLNQLTQTLEAAHRGVTFAARSGEHL